MDSQIAVEALMDVDPGFAQLCETLFGDAIDPADAWQFLYSPEPVVKMSPDSADVSTKGGIGGKIKRVAGTRKGKLVAAAGLVTMGSGIGYNLPKKGSSNQYGYSITKADEATDEDSFGVTWAGEFSKMDDEKRQVFGWASVVEVDGRPVIDRQGDWITPDEIEKAAYKYVQDSRKGGHQHKRTDDDQPFHASNMIESIVFTPEKIEKMGLPSDFPVGWWVGYQVHDEETWDKVKKGDVTGFSIHGRGKRRQIAEVDV